MTELDRVLGPAFEDARELALTDQEVAGIVARAAGRVHRRRRLWILAIAPAALLAAGASYIATRPSAEKLAATGIACSDAPRPDANMTIVSARGRDPIALCGDLWRQRIVDATVRAAPPLVACSGVGEMSAVLVYPSSDDGLCERLGQVPLPAGFADANARLAGLQRMQSDPGALCGRSSEEVVARARRELARSGLLDWTVVMGRTLAPDECPAIVIDADRHEVQVLASEEGTP